MNATQLNNMHNVKVFFNEEENKIIKAFYPMTNTNFLAKTLLKRHTRRQITSRAHFMGIDKAPNYERECKFQPGNIPPNKGHYTSTHPGVIKERNRKRSRLKNGMVKTIGQMTWFKNHGYYPPEGYCITYKDGDFNNNQIENLEMISRAELISRTHKRTPKFLRDLILTRCALVRMLNNHEKHKAE